MLMIDGLQCGYIDEAVCTRLKRAGFDCVTVTVGFWEDTLETMDLIAKFKALGRLPQVRLVHQAEDILQAQKEQQLALIIGSQNAELLGGRIRFVELFADMGLRVMQLTYNNQNALAGSCYEEVDSGLSRFGREVITEMNRMGILIDLSHVGNHSTLQAIQHSKKPVAITHANAMSLVPHPRNKNDEVLKALRDNGGIIGCATYRNITGDDYLSSVDRWAELVVKTVEIAGIDHVGLGTDIGHGHELHDYDWMINGRWSRGASNKQPRAEGIPGKVQKADWIEDLTGFAQLPAALNRQGLSKAEVDKILYKNWLRVYRDVFLSK